MRCRPSVQQRSLLQLGNTHAAGAMTTGQEVAATRQQGTETSLTRMATRSSRMADARDNAVQVHSHVVQFANTHRKRAIAEEEEYDTSLPGFIVANKQVSMLPVA